MAPNLRLATERDAAQILAIYRPIVENTPISFELEPPSLDEIRQRIATLTARLPWLVCEDGASLLGYAYASPYRVRAAYQWSVDVSAYVHPQARRSGVGRALYTSLFEILTRQGYYNTVAGIALPNPASVGFHEALGFDHVGVYRHVGYKLGAWHDVGWWQLALQKQRGSPQPPQSVADVRNLPQWKHALAAGEKHLRLREGLR